MLEKEHALYVTGCFRKRNLKIKDVAGVKKNSKENVEPVSCCSCLQADIGIVQNVALVVQKPHVLVVEN